MQPARDRDLARRKPRGLGRETPRRRRTRNAARRSACPPSTDGVPRALTAARDGQPHRERDVAWSPDGREIAFLSDAAQDGQLQLYVAPAAGGRRACSPARRASSSTRAGHRMASASPSCTWPGPPRSRARSSPTSRTRAWSRRRSRSSASRSSTPPGASCARSAPPISTCTTTTGRRTAGGSRRKPSTARGRTTTGRPSCTWWMRPAARRAPSGSRRSRSRSRDGRRIHGAAEAHLGNGLPGDLSYCHHVVRAVRLRDQGLERGEVDDDLFIVKGVRICAQRTPLMFSLLQREELPRALIGREDARR